MSGFIQRAGGVLHKIEISTLVVLGVAMTLIMFSNAALRYLFSTSLVWSEEVIRLLFVWAMFIAITGGFIRNAHIGFDNFSDFGAKAALVNRFGYAATLTVVGGVLAWFGFIYAGYTGDVPLAATNLPTGLLMWPGVVAGCVWMIIGAVRLVAFFRDLVRAREEPAA
ncbi:MAG: TRAP transporter small permease subunit [Alphaproteobacteria bacterium]|nr:TRAP transporter small permease subunit [Alphaproteobacteria bacterium]